MAELTLKLSVNPEFTENLAVALAAMDALADVIARGDIARID